MSRVDLGFLSPAFDLALDHRRVTLQFLGTSAALLILEMTAGIARMAHLQEGVGWLLGFPLFYAALMAVAVAVCASCRHTVSARGGGRPFDALQALTQGLLPAAAGSAVFFLVAAAAALLVGILLGLGKVHAGILSLLALPLGVVLALALGLLLSGQLLFPPLAAVSNGDLDSVFAQVGRVLRTRLLRVLCQEAVALALSALFTGMLLAVLWGGWLLLCALGQRFFPADFPGILSQGPMGFFYRMERLALASAVLAPAQVFLNASSYLILSSAAPEPAPAAAFDEEEEAWLQP